ncbi:CRAL-TRIO domain [Pseudocohnilembus persalinus]|uniref:CRAL-TRIO domain n=1 Tax=Pseudocohnilembus persalinus TaxID=266149 RepID=A0A0V0QU93_PSEPJ|nr:CRAL-TRIO domain [Pseudocohnilembus persalinus]|eukprot:KRX05787.1 CRAL-TRIO domain [Pseudocohnilembus persalinus]
MVEETANKLCMLAESEYKKLQESIPASQLQQKYGGTLPNITNFWPPENIDHLMPGAQQSQKSQQQIKEINLNGQNNNNNQKTEIELQQQSNTYINNGNGLQLMHQESDYYSLVNDSQQFFSEDYTTDKELAQLQTPLGKNKYIDIREDNKEIYLTNGEDRSSCCTCQIF